MEATQPTHAERLDELYDAFNQGDIEPVMDAMADDITWFEPAGEPHAGTHRGPDEVLQNVLGQIPQQVDAFTATPNQYIEDDDHVAVEGVYNVTSKSGTDYEIPFAHVWRLDAGELQEFRDYSDTHVYREAFGV